MKKITKKAARKDLTGLNLASLKRKLARLEFRLKVLEGIHKGPLEIAVKNIKKGKWE